jgi:hypothetical protein
MDGCPLTGTTQNVLACCSFDLKFQYFLSGADSASSNTTLFINECTSNLSYHQASITLPMQGFLAVIHLLYYTDRYSTILQNGAVLILGESAPSPAPLSLSCCLGQSPSKNCSTFSMLVHVTPLNESLVCSNYRSSSSHVCQNTACVSKHKSHPP